MENPDRNVLDAAGQHRISAAADGGDGGEALRVLRGQVPGAEAAHGEPGEIDAIGIDVIFALNVIQ